MILADRIQLYKESVSLRDLAEETHHVTRGKVLCPFHGDKNPSCHLYEANYFCFGCGEHGDHLDWLERVQGYSKSEAIDELAKRAGGYVASITATVKAEPEWKPTPLPDTALTYLRRKQAALDRVPPSLLRHGFSLTDLKRIGVAAVGDDAIIPVFDPQGDVVALKRRLVAPQEGDRYRYMVSGHGSPAWCSPNLMACNTLLSIEGELNGARSYLSLIDTDVHVGVVGSAGANGHLPKGVYAGKDIFIYTDPDTAGESAKARWRAQAITEGAKTVTELPYLPVEDACDLAHQRSADALSAWFKEHMQLGGERWHI